MVERPCREDIKPWPIVVSVNLKPWGLAVVVPGWVPSSQQRRGGGPQSRVLLERSVFAVSLAPGGGSQSRVFFLFVCGWERDVASGPNPRHRELETSPSPNLSLSPKGTSQGFVLGDSSAEQRGVANGGGKVVFGKLLAICGVEMESADT